VEKPSTATIYQSQTAWPHLPSGTFVWLVINRTRSPQALESISVPDVRAQVIGNARFANIKYSKN
jgi:hypothetical protein